MKAKSLSLGGFGRLKRWNRDAPGVGQRGSLRQDDGERFVRVCRGRSGVSPDSNELEGDAPGVGQSNSSDQVEAGQKKPVDWVSPAIVGGLVVRSGKETWKGSPDFATGGVVYPGIQRCGVPS